MQLLACSRGAGMLRGLFKLDLGVLTSWGEMVTEFYRAPARCVVRPSACWGHLAQQAAM